MTTDTPFLTASRKKFRYETGKGLLNTEQLWDLPLDSTNPSATSLNSVAKGLSRTLKADAEEDFVKTQTPKDNPVADALEVVKGIIAVRIAERDAAEAQKLKAAKRQQILGLLAEKDTEVLKGKTKEELLKELEDL